MARVFHANSYHFPHVVTENFKPKYNAIKWLNNSTDFEKWCTGKTGYPIVDAGMRQLNKTGYMHNRVRMITAGFYVNISLSIGDLEKHILQKNYWTTNYLQTMGIGNGQQGQVVTRTLF